MRDLQIPIQSLQLQRTLQHFQEFRLLSWRSFPDMPRIRGAAETCHRFLPFRGLSWITKITQRRPCCDCWQIASLRLFSVFFENVRSCLNSTSGWGTPPMQMSAGHLRVRCMKCWPHRYQLINEGRCPTERRARLRSLHGLPVTAGHSRGFSTRVR